MAYNRVNWENLPSTNTPINATNLNKMDAGIANAVEKTGDTMTGDLTMQGNSVKFGNTGNIQWKEDGYGDKFRIMPDFNGVGSNNKLVLQSTIGGAGEDPSNWINIADFSADNGDLSIKGKLQASNINTQKRTWGNSMSFTMQVGQHALVMINQSDCLIIWVAGVSSNPYMSVARIYGNEVQVNFDASTNTVTITYQDNREFTGNAIIL